MLQPKGKHNMGKLFYQSKLEALDYL